jgi:hypothetical protein
LISELRVSQKGESDGCGNHRDRDTDRHKDENAGGYPRRDETPSGGAEYLFVATIAAKPHGSLARREYRER